MRSEDQATGGAHGGAARAVAVMLAAVLCAGPAGRALAQEGACELVASTSGPVRQILRCPSGPTIEAEDKADVRVQGGSHQPSSATVGAGAALVDVPPGYPGGFQILTPRAVASVRGTLWAVDVEPSRTSVFVVRGEVRVRRTAGGPEVALRQGEGVDVGDGDAALQVTHWPAARAAALLARFGRR